MATSNTATFNITVNDLIQEEYEIESVEDCCEYRYY